MGGEGVYFSGFGQRSVLLSHKLLAELPIMFLKDLELPGSFISCRNSIKIKLFKIFSVIHQISIKIA